MQNGSGYELLSNAVRFKVWAPKPKTVELYLSGSNGGNDRLVPMDKVDEFWQVKVEGAGVGTRYMFRIDGEVTRPDPCSRFQPEGVHGPSEVISTDFQWTDQTWFGVPLKHHVIYELHVGTFTKEGTFDAVIPHLPALADLGITALELMPVAQCPGERNWGYDGVYPYAVQNSYGGAAGLARLVDAAHRAGMAVLLDVVYNHLGPEGNYLEAFGPYFTDDYKTPWGPAINFGGEYSDQVRQFFLNNAAYWIKDFHMDGLRLDACHLVLDPSAMHILEELKRFTGSLSDELNRRVHLFAESDANDPRYISAFDINGFGLDCQWLDDYHHSLYTLLNGAGCDIYIDDYFSTRHLAKAYREGFVYSGQYCPTRKHKHGRSSMGIPGEKFVVFIQNHDQVGNKPGGTRLANELTFEGLKVAAAAYLLSPYVPLIFMGEEYGETRPFYFFTDYGDEQVIEGMMRGRAEEFGSGPDADQLRDPQRVKTFEDSKLAHENVDREKGELIKGYYKKLLGLRRKLPALAELDKHTVKVYHRDNSVTIERHSVDDETVIFLNFDSAATEALFPLTGNWERKLDSAAGEWGGPGNTAPEQLQVTRTCHVTVPVQGESVLVYTVSNGESEQ